MVLGLTPSSSMECTTVKLTGFVLQFLNDMLLNIYFLFISYIFIL